VQPLIAQDKLESASTRDVLVGVSEVSGIKQLNDRTPGSGSVSKKVEHIPHLVGPSGIKEAGAVGTVNYLPIVRLIGIPRQVVFDETKLVAPSQVPEQFAEATEEQTSPLCAAQASPGVPDFQHNARQLDGAPASRVDAALPIQQFINDLQK
jgi:hypothetical protein